EEDRGDEDEDLVEQSGLQAAAGGLGAEDVDVAVPGQLLGAADRRVQVGLDLDSRDRLGRWVTGEENGRPVILPAERALGLGVAVRVVAEEGPTADEQAADLVDERVRRGARLERQP